MRHAWTLLIALLSVPAAAGEPHDLAYVDSPQRKAVPDPARADAATASPAQAQVQAQYVAGQHAAQQQAQTARQIAAQMEQFTAAHVAASNQQQPHGAAGAGAAYADPPVGGRNLADELLAAGIPMQAQPMDPGMQASPARQLGSALLQDAAGVVDGRIQGEIDGPDGRVLPPPWPEDPERTGRPGD